jgi:hypothetical protein
MRLGEFQAARDHATSENLGDSPEAEALRQVISETEKKGPRKKNPGQGDSEGDFEFFGVSGWNLLYFSAAAVVAALGFWQLQKKTEIF